MPEIFVATVRITVSAEDEVEANLILDSLRAQMLMALSPEDDGDEVVVTQVIPFTGKHTISFQELCDVLRRDRNILIRTRSTEMWDIARSMDESIYRIEHGLDELANYDYGHFMDVAARVLKGENPID